MKEIIEFCASGASVSAVLIGLFIIGKAVGYIEKAAMWVHKYFLLLYRRKKGIEEKEATMKEVLDAIYELNTKFDTCTTEIEELRVQVEEINEAGARRDCAILRDRILQAVRYFKTNRIGEDGRVHIPYAEYENLDHLFTEYFGAHGNGTIKDIYNDEFKSWVKDVT